ncbi:hypothetical protein L1987_38912 [Smallanthus sonchifolius]|uniref:Uncharacterized protein n=1 Tax=Smallanthus sonchifolius TaxID=185202 RepID=A0ACB9HKI5_9ASTR|nr:hypothetical protein L1987_38912 [Smallanthus sonchifolius]
MSLSSVFYLFFCSSPVSTHFPPKLCSLHPHPTLSSPENILLLNSHHRTTRHQIETISPIINIKSRFE